MKNISKDCIDFYSLIGEEDRVWTTEWKNFTNTKSGKRKKRYTDDEPCCFENYETEIKKRERRALRLKLRSSKYFLDQAKAKVTVDSDSESLLLDIQSLYPSGIVTTDPKWWKFFGALDLDGFPFWGHFSVYGGGGYSAPFKDDVLSSFKVSASLANYHWIDRYSRGVFIEFSVYSPDTNIFATSFMLFEVHPTGALRTQSGVKTFSIYRYHGKSKNATMSGEIIVILFLFYFIYREIRQMINEKCKYFKSVFNWVDVLIIIFTFCGVILWLGRWYQEDKVLLAYKNNQDKYHSFPYAAAANELFIYVVALIVYLCTMRMMRVLNVFPVVVLFLGVLKSSRMKLLAFLLPFLVMFLAFVQLSYSFFNTNEHFSSFVRTIITLFLATLGGPYYYEMKAANSILGPIFYFSFSLFTVMVMLNLLISIINDAIADETGNFASSQKDLEFVEYLFTKINSVIRIEMVDVSSLAELREQQERKMAKIEKMREKRQKEIEEKLKRLQEGQEAYLLLGKRIKDAKNTLDTICANLDKYISMIEGDNKKMMTIITSNEVIPFNSKSESSKKY